LQTESGVDGFHSVKFYTELLQPGPQPLYFTARNSTVLPDPLVVGRSPALNNLSMNMLMNFRSNSLTATYNVVPEPSPFVQLGCLILLVGKIPRIRQ
jgi:hypothetical protein